MGSGVLLIGRSPFLQSPGPEIGATFAPQWPRRSILRFCNCHSFCRASPATSKTAFMPHKFDGYCSFARSHLAAMERTAAAQKTPAVTVSVLAAEGFFPEWLQKLAFCPHGVLAGKYRSRCERCVREQKEIEEKHRREQELLERQQRIERERQEREQRIDAAAASLQRRERLRLATSLIPSIEELRRLSWQQFENEVAGMFERMGYKVQQTPPCERSRPRWHPPEKWRKVLV
jgi:hypothetical protein